MNILKQLGWAGLGVGLAIVAILAAGRQPALADQGGAGTLDAVDKEGKPVGSCPLEHTDVSVDVSGFIARVTVIQRFGNPFQAPIEAIYTFPLSERAAVDAMTMRIGDRVIKGVVKEREEARRIYEAARDAGKAASLLDQERPNIFTQSVANILPGQNVEIEISYVEYLKYEAGEYEFAFPMVVGPRYIPGTPVSPPANALKSDVDTGLKPGPASTNVVPDASRVTPPVTPEGTRAGHDIALEVRIDAGVAVQGVKSELHEVEVERPSDTRAVVRLKDKATIPNRDFILRYQVAGKDVGDAVLAHAGDKGGFVTLVLQPPQQVHPKEVTPKEMLFVIDRSGSMSGFPIEKAKKTMRLCIEAMSPNDTFNLVSFSGGLGQCFPGGPVANTEENRKKALEYLANLDGGGGTEMMAAIRAALEGQKDPERLRVVCFMTDGFIGNDMEILGAIQANVGKSRVFAFGIGNSVNRFLIEGMGRTGRGASEIVSLESDADAAAKRFHERIQSPLLTDITVDLGNLPIQDLYPDPKAIPDLFAARPLVLTGRYTGTAQGTITVRGQTAQGPFERAVAVSLPQVEPAHDVLAPLWARERIAALMQEDWAGLQSGQPKPEMKAQITKLGLEFSLVTQFTSFVAVEERVITEAGKTKTVQVPVEMPDGVSYEGVFGEQAEAKQAGSWTLGRKFMAAPAAAPTPAQATMPTMAGGNLQADFQTPPATAPAEPSKPADAPAPPAESTAKPEPKKDEAARAKLDARLLDLASKLVNGAYTNGPVKVRNGWVAVFIRLEALNKANLDSLRQAGVNITSERASAAIVFARVRVEDLEKVAGLAFVKRVEPTTYE